MAMQNTTQISARDAGTITLGDLTVNRLGFGAMQLPGPRVWGEPADPDNARAVLRRTLDLGLNLIDTSDYYGPHVANRLIAEALYPYPDDLVIATKVGGKRGPDASWLPELHPDDLRVAVEANLTRLRLDHLDLVFLRAFEGHLDIPLADSFGALADLRTQGKIRHLGISSIDVAQLAEVQAIAPVVAVENLYNLAHRHEDAMIDLCAAQGIAFMPYFPLAMGHLTGAMADLSGLRGMVAPGLDRMTGPLASIARAHNASPAQIALAWLLARSPIMVPIPGTSSLAHLEENVAAASLHLTDDEMAALA